MILHLMVIACNHAMAVMTFQFKALEFVDFHSCSWTQGVGEPPQIR